MATSIAEPTTENVFADQLKRLADQNAATAAETQRQLAELNNRTAWLPNPRQQVQQPTEFDFAAPTQSVQQTVREMIQREVAPAVNDLRHHSWENQRYRAREIAKGNSSVADVFAHFGAEIDSEVAASVSQAGQTDPAYWIKAAKLVAHDNRTELEKKIRASSRAFNETPAGGGSASPSGPKTELSAHLKDYCAQMGWDPSDPKILDWFNRRVA